jgi:hypothetical protein
MSDWYHPINPLVGYPSKSCPGCRQQKTVAMRLYDLMAWQRGADLDKVMMYVSTDDRERLRTGWCPVCIPDELPPPPGPRPAAKPVPGHDRSVPKASLVHARSPDLIERSIPCTVEECGDRGTETFLVFRPMGPVWLRLCPRHLAEVRAEVIQDRLRDGIATARDWSITPMDGAVELPAPPRRWSTAEWEIVRHGLVPRAMEERWFWYVQDTVLHAHRSWSGVEVFDARFVRRGDGYVIDRLRVTSGKHRRLLFDPSDGSNKTRAASAAVELIESELLRIPPRWSGS